VNLPFPLLLLLGFACAWTHDARADLTSYVQEHGLTRLYPARPNFGSGTVFRIERSADGSRYARVLCRNLFAGITVVRTPIVLKTMAFSDSEGFTEALGIVYGLLTNARQAEENLRAQHIGVVKLFPMDAAIEQLPPTVQFTQTGAAFALDSTCLAALIKLKREDDFEGIHIVNRALFVSRFRIELERPPEYNLDAMEVLGVDSDHETQSKGPNAVEVMAPYYIGMSSMLIVDLGPADPGAAPNKRVIKAAAPKLVARFRAWE
jgi:hypothetical protein